MRRLLATAALVALAACAKQGGDADQEIGANPPLPAISMYLIPPMHVVPPSPWGNKMPTVPAGLRVQPLATGLSHPRSLYTLPNGDILVVETDGPPEPIHRPKDIVMQLIQAHGHNDAPKAGMDIVLLRDTNGDGVPDLRTKFITGLHSPFGVALIGNDLYVANTDAILRFPYQPGQTQITAPGQKLLDLPAGRIDHRYTKSLVASADGSKLYVGIGSNSNITENGMDAELDRARIWEVDPKTGAHRAYATGLRNPNGLQFEPTSHQLWAVVNERDELGPDLVPDYMTSVRDGGFYGWPYSYWGSHADPRVAPQRPDMVAKAIVPDYGLSSHVAPLGMVFSETAAALPPTFRSGAFVGEHGSWDRGHLNGYKVIYVPFANGRPAGKAQDVVTGFVEGEHAHGRPVGLGLDKTGALLIADDLGNTVWRVSATGQTAMR
jgi:glucose/arabinose dehydrogenase